MRIYGNGYFPLSQNENNENGFATMADIAYPNQFQIERTQVKPIVEKACSTALPHSQTHIHRTQSKVALFDFQNKAFRRLT